MATKPSGRPKASSAATTPISPSGRIATTRPSRAKLCNWNISAVSITTIMMGTTAKTEARLFALSSAIPPISMA